MKRMLITCICMCLVLFLWAAPAYADTKTEKAVSFELTNPAIKRFDARFSRSAFVSARVLFDSNNTLQAREFPEVYDIIIDTVGEEPISNVITVYEIIDGGRTLALNYSAVVGFDNLFNDSTTNYVVSGYCEFYADGNAYVPQQEIDQLHY